MASENFEALLLLCVIGSKVTSLFFGHLLTYSALSWDGVKEGQFFFKFFNNAYKNVSPFVGRVPLPKAA